MMEEVPPTLNKEEVIPTTLPVYPVENGSCASTISQLKKSSLQARIPIERFSLEHGRIENPKPLPLDLLSRTRALLKPTGRTGPREARGAVMSHHFHAIIHSPFLPVAFAPGADAPSLGVSVASPSRRAVRLPRARASVEKREQTMEEQGGAAALGWAARDATGVLSPYNFSRR